MKIKKGDKVLIIKGRDRGKSGNVLSVFPVSGKIAVEGLNLIKKRTRARKSGEKGQTISVPSPFYAANASIICARCSKPARVGYKIESDKKFRICKKCKQEI